jgi:hypothetical protein
MMFAAWHRCFRCNSLLENLPKYCQNGADRLNPWVTGPAPDVGVQAQSPVKFPKFVVAQFRAGIYFCRHFVFGHFIERP